MVSFDFSLGFNAANFPQKKSYNLDTTLTNFARAR